LEFQPIQRVLALQFVQMLRRLLLLNLPQLQRLRQR
jgi:hypothetical protein